MSLVEDLKLAIEADERKTELEQAERDLGLARDRWEARQHFENWQQVAYAEAKFKLLRERAARTL